MKMYYRVTIATVVCLPMLGVLCGCTGTTGIPGSLGAGATSQFCSNISGPLAIEYDVQSGGITTALTTVPVVATIGGSFTHPDFPLLSFIYPTGWTPETIQGPQTVGVNLVRDDQQAIWRWVSAQIANGMSTRMVLDLEVEQMRQFLGATGSAETICITEGGGATVPGVNNQSSSTVVRWDSFTAIIAVSATFVDGLPAGAGVVVAAGGPTAEIDALIFNTFLPIHFQLLVGNGLKDSDGDGVYDSNDNFPSDPTRS